jgi:hypothetical protein
MSTQTNLVGAYLAQGTIGNVGMPGSPIVHFSFVVVPSQHKVSGSVHVTQATQNGNYSGQVTGTLYATGFGNVAQVVAVRGSVHSDGEMPIEIPFEAHLAIDGSWNGTGGFAYANTHVENVPVTSSK